MSWHYSQALVAAYSAENCSDGEQSAQLRSNPTPQLYSSSAKMTAFCRRSRYGMTCEPLTENHGEALLTWFLAGFHARTSAQQGRAQELTAIDQGCGRKWHALSVKFDRSTSSWKIHHSLFPEDLPESSVTLPRWGMMQDGELWERTMPELHTSATEFGLWPTPVASEATAGARIPDGKRGPRLTDIVKRPDLWPTPTSSMMTINDMEQAKYHSSKRPSYQECYPTPAATDWKTGYRADSAAGMAQREKRAKPLRDQQAPGGQLNPTWLEWLMGWPLGWTELSPLAMDRFHEWQLWHGKPCAND